jgi:two-component system, cell cycle response regulator
LGDQCLQQVAAGLGSTLKHDDDLSARYGGEEFAAILPNTSLEQALVVARKIQSQVEQLRLIHGQSPISPYLTLSFGVASLVPKPEQSPRLLVDAADRALYSAKQTGRNRIVHSSVPAPPCGFRLDAKPGLAQNCP